jgi:hypothetical protein
MATIQYEIHRKKNDNRVCLLCDTEIENDVTFCSKCVQSKKGMKLVNEIIKSFQKPLVVIVLHQHNKERKKYAKFDKYN